uniref:RNA-binding protein 3-like n=1 Tax=Pristiophorus japonicus TaxID=55135 RepID=UPI00398F3359
MGKVRGSWEDFIPPQTAVSRVPKEQRRPSWRRKKQFIGSRNPHTDEQTLEEQFCRCGPIAGPRAGDVLRAMSGRSIDGRQIRGPMQRKSQAAVAATVVAATAATGEVATATAGGAAVAGTATGAEATAAAEATAVAGVTRENASQSGGYGSIYGDCSHRDYD